MENNYDYFGKKKKKKKYLGIWEKLRDIWEKLRRRIRRRPGLCEKLRGTFGVNEIFGNFGRRAI